MNAQSVQVVVVGNIGIDTNVYLPGKEIDFNVEANFTRNLDMIGQAGGYASRGYSSLGYHTAFIGSVGADFSGNHIRKELEHEKINVDGLFIDPEGTSRSINFMYPDGRRKNFYDGKGHMHIEPPMFKCERLFAGAKLAHFNIPNWARKLLPIARREGVIIATDIQDVVSFNDPYRIDFVKGSDFLFFSAANHSDPSVLIQEYLEVNPSLVIVSGMGADGCMLGTRDGWSHYPPIKMDLPVVDTNGAGDALAVGFLSSHVLEHRSLEESIYRGQVCARHICTQAAPHKQMISNELLEHVVEVTK